MPNLSNHGRPADKIIFVVEDDAAHFTAPILALVDTGISIQTHVRR
jgi:hypothetical protein